jgi:cysteine-S-conjugate beta-lyase
VYPPFLAAPGFTERELVSIPLVRAPVLSDAANGSSPAQEEQWTFDFAAMAAALAAKPDIKLLLLCSPHNPVGRVFSSAELSLLGKFCEQHSLIICSDEIHCDLLLDEGVQHVPMAAVEGGRYASRTITVNAPSKVSTSNTFSATYRYCIKVLSTMSLSVPLVVHSSLTYQ